MRSRIRAITFAGAVALLATAPAAAFAATPVDNGCPAAGAITSIADLLAQGDYGVPGRIDDPANGGNGDGYVCAFPLPQAVADAWGQTITMYMFFENNLKAQGQP